MGRQVGWRGTSVSESFFALPSPKTALDYVVCRFPTTAVAGYAPHPPNQKPHKIKNKKRKIEGKKNKREEKVEFMARLSPCVLETSNGIYAGQRRISCKAINSINGGGERERGWSPPITCVSGTQMPKANGGEGRWVGGRRERNEGRMEGRYEGWKERQFCFSSSKFILISPTEIFGVFMQISKFYLGQKLVQGIFKYKKYSMRRTFSHPKLIFPFQYFFHPKFNMPLGYIYILFWVFFPSTIQSVF